MTLQKIKNEKRCRKVNLKDYSTFQIADFEKICSDGRCFKQVKKFVS